ncbi:MAG TPA: hypothetical protein VHZ95_11230, partial [Polyangiales bacterium]|nr:hypothetical protein [Polyangiales bacterium]
MLVQLGVLFAGWLFVPSAHASPCQTDSDCPARFTCTTIGQTACTTPTPCTGSNCPTTPPCALKDIKACSSQTCQRDDDCPDDMICFTDGNSAPNCIPPYLLTCVRSSDCGDGFDCVAATTTQCSNGSRSCMSQRGNEYICALQKT